jgi:ubiquinone/menaquinone biosynthesis C-methylase UbiE
MPKTPQPSPRYASDILAWEYDQRQPLPLPGELEWYLEYAKKPGNSILELACGSGRLLIPIAQAGYKIHGVDSSAAMLNRLLQKVIVLDEKIRRNISLFQSDILEFKPSQTYGMVMIAYNSVREFETIEKVTTCFKHVYDLLNPGGYFLFTIRRLTPSSFSGEKKLIYDSVDKPFTDASRGISVGVRIISYPVAGNRMAHEQMYIIKQPTREPEHLSFTSYTNTIDIVGYLKMLNNFDFTSNIFSGYDERPDDGKSREICIVCRK